MHRGGRNNGHEFLHHLRSPDDLSFLVMVVLMLLERNRCGQAEEGAEREKTLREHLADDRI